MSFLTVEITSCPREQLAFVDPVLAVSCMWVSFSNEDTSCFLVPHTSSHPIDIAKDIAATVENGRTYLKHQLKPREPLKPAMISGRPWQQIATNLFHF